MHCGAKHPTSSPDEIQNSNVAWVKEIADLALHHSADLIFCSSTAVYGPVTGLVDERSDCRPVDSYSTAKLWAERYLMESGVRCLSARLPAILQDSDTKGWISKLLVRLINHQPIDIPSGLSPYNSLLSRRQFAEFVYSLGPMEEYDMVNLACTPSHSLWEIITYAKSRLRSRSELAETPGGETRYYSINKAHQGYGYKLTSPPEAINMWSDRLRSESVAG